MTDGVTVGVVQTPRGSRVVTGVESWSAPLVRRFTADGWLEKESYAFDAASRSGVSVTAWDMDQDGADEIVTVPNGEAPADVRVYDMYGTEYRRALVMDEAYRGGVSAAAFGSRLLTIPVLPTVVTTPVDAKSILVDLSQQRLYAFERGRLARTFLVSTGTSRFPTPVMSVAVRQKIPVKTYRWSYGPGNPNNYNLPGVEWNLQINGPYYIHYAYWHNNFGNPMSHGCINVGRADSEWIYHWADVGTKVEVMN
jgi:lipoprotein-anchoring transpeptidase ErfK/SrfK